MWLLNNPCYHDNLTDAGKFFWLMLLCTMADQIKHWLFWNCLDSFLELNSPKLTWVLKSLYFEVLPMMMILPTVLVVRSSHLEVIWEIALLKILKILKKTHMVKFFFGAVASFRRRAALIKWTPSLVFSWDFRKNCYNSYYVERLSATLQQ